MQAVEGAFVDLELRYPGAHVGSAFARFAGDVDLNLASAGAVLRSTTSPSQLGFGCVIVFLIAP
jgi:hypothetical protein